jgi:hypothetical protein
MAASFRYRWRHHVVTAWRFRRNPQGSGRMVIGSASPEAYGRIEDYARKMKSSATGAKINEAAAANQPIAPSPHSATGPSSTALPSGAAPGATATSTTSASSVAPISPWASLRVGSTVLAAYWNEEKEIEGWWPAVITRADDNEFRLRWRDTTEYTLGKVEPKRLCHVVDPRTRRACALSNFTQPWPPRATCSSPRRGGFDAFGPR